MLMHHSAVGGPSITARSTSSPALSSFCRVRSNQASRFSGSCRSHLVVLLLRSFCMIVSADCEWFFSVLVTMFAPGLSESRVAEPTNAFSRTGASRVCERGC